MERRPSLTGILVKPAGADCDLRCKYCFYLDKKALYPKGPRLCASYKQLFEHADQPLRRLAMDFMK